MPRGPAPSAPWEALPTEPATFRTASIQLTSHREVPVEEVSSIKPESSLVSASKGHPNKSPAVVADAIVPVDRKASGGPSKGAASSLDQEALYAGSSQLDSFIAGLDENKALEGALVAIGFLAVLLAIGAYIQPLPGGPNPSWASCSYGVFTAFVVLNSAALAFSSAAIVAVVLGPWVLILQKREAWRRQAVQLGIFNAGVSLLALLAAYICAMLIRAAVGKPDPSCARLLCSAGGVPCSPYSVRFNSGASIGTTAAQSSRNVVNLTSLADVELLLDSSLVSLNRQQLADGRSPEHWADTVVCHHYGLIVNNSLANGTDLRVPDVGTNGNTTINPCFVLLGSTAFQGPFNDQDGHAFRPDTRTLWCSPNRDIIGPGWLPLTLNNASMLVGSSANFLEQGYAMTSAGLSGTAKVCPSAKLLGSSRLVFMNLTLSQHVSVQAHDLLQNVSFQSSVGCGAVLLYDPNFTQYLGILGGLQALHFFCEGNGHCDKQLWDQIIGSFNTTLPNNQPLHGAVPYEALRYRCSGSCNSTESHGGVFCDHSVNPPLAVDLAGRYLSASGQASQDGVVFFTSQALNFPLYLAVLKTLIIYFVAAVINACVLSQRLSVRFSVMIKSCADMFRWVKSL